MNKKKLLISILAVFIYLNPLLNSCLAQSISFHNDPKTKKLFVRNNRIELTIDYDKKAAISLLRVNGQTVIAGDSGIFSSFNTKEAGYSTLHLSKDPAIQATKNAVTLSGIAYGDKAVSINETWTFTGKEGGIQFRIDRTNSVPFLAEKAAMPGFNFSHINTWEGAYTDYGGLAWFYLFNKKLDTYAVHSHSSEFWNSKTGNGLSIAVESPGNQVAMDYSRTADDKLAFTVANSRDEIPLRFDSGTNRRRYIRDRTDVWAAFRMPAGKTSETISLSWFDFNERYGRGKLNGINQDQVSAVLNTIARIGVIDKQHFGGNSWHTPYGPICLHEQYIAQMGLGINDSSYLRGYEECLRFYRDNAIKPDGRVWPRWAYSNEDAMPGQFTGKGFYEAQWGYLLDANPDYVSNVAELYDQTGNKSWVKDQQLSCEKALDWILARDSNQNGLVEMMTGSHSQKRGSDWIDIIWASFENAFVNAKLYHALVLWSDIENQLGNQPKAKYYADFAGKLKNSFNKTVAEGGFWDDTKQCYIHWRDQDGSIHGNNMVTAVNFMAIAYGICDDKDRMMTILDNIEQQMQKEQLFFWPLCLYSYAAGEGNDWQFPFPNYENGDIFLSWGSVAVKAYASYKPALALKYVKNVLAQYAKDGLAFQRYGRTKQDGLGDDILSGNSLCVVGLYQAVYGINPKYNRFFLDPHITEDLAGTQVKYNFRGQKLLIDLNPGAYAVSNKRFKLISAEKFGFFAVGNELRYFHGESADPCLRIRTDSSARLTVQIKHWGEGRIAWKQLTDEKQPVLTRYQVNGLKPGREYLIRANSKLLQSARSGNTGILKFECRGNKEWVEFDISEK